jgi:site-specific DNA recombinase
LLCILITSRQKAVPILHILVDGLTSPTKLLDRTPGIPSEPRLAVTLRSTPRERGRIVRELVEQVILDEKQIIIKLRRGALVCGDDPSRTSEAPSDSSIELIAAVDFKRRGVDTKMVLPGLAQHKLASRGDPVLIKAIARGCAWFEELATGQLRSLHELAQRDGITRRYIRRLVDLAFLSPQLVEAILQGQQPVELTATRLTELDLPLDWTEQHRLLAS